MSNVMMFGNPAADPRYAAPTTPVLGPERTVRTGKASAVGNGMMPPLLCVTCGTTWRPSSARLPRRRARYSATVGPIYALVTTVESRSNSRNSGSTSEEMDTYASGISSAMMRAMARSWSGCR